MNNKDMTEFQDGCRGKKATNKVDYQHWENIKNTLGSDIVEGFKLLSEHTQNKVAQAWWRTIPKDEKHSLLKRSYAVRMGGLTASEMFIAYHSKQDVKKERNKKQKNPVPFPVYVIILLFVVPFCVIGTIFSIIGAILMTVGSYLNFDKEFVPIVWRKVKGYLTRRWE